MPFWIIYIQRKLKKGESWKRQNYNLIIRYLSN